MITVDWALSDDPDSRPTSYQTTRTLQEDMAPTDQGQRDRCGCYTCYDPTPEGVEKGDKADPRI